MTEFKRVFRQPKVAIGVIHLLPLPGSPGYLDNLDAAIERGVTEARMLEEAGFGGLIVENFGDIPFLKDKVSAVTTAAMAIATREIASAVSIPVGVNVLRNDYASALAVAGVSRCSFIRVNVLVGGYITTEGIIEGNPGAVHRLKQIVSPETLIFADVMVKHAYRIGEIDVGDDALDVAERGKADCLIITGRRTGSPPSAEDLKQVRAKLEENGIDKPLLVGSGLSAANADKFLRLCDGFIVSSSLRDNGKAGQPIDPQRLRDFQTVLEGVSKKKWI